MVIDDYLSEYWQDPSQVNQYGTYDNGTVQSNGTVSQPGWFGDILKSVVGAGASLGTAYLTAEQKKQQTVTAAKPSSTMILVIVGVLAVILLGGAALLFGRRK